MKICNIPNYKHLQDQASWEKHKEGLILCFCILSVLKASSHSRDTEEAIIFTWKLQFGTAFSQLSALAAVALFASSHDPCRPILTSM